MGSGCEDTLQVSVVAGGDDDWLDIRMRGQRLGGRKPIRYAQFRGDSAGDLGTGIGDGDELGLWDMSSEVLGVAPPDRPHSNYSHPESWCHVALPLAGSAGDQLELES